ncbi:MAG: hypothetical protein ACFFFK_09055, partial [Candidatus Thorarchaeota archaeon]
MTKAIAAGVFGSMTRDNINPPSGVIFSETLDKVFIGGIGTSVGKGIGGVVNNNPIAENLTLTSSPSSIDDLEASYDYSDSDGHIESDTQIQWYKN